MATNSLARISPTEKSFSEVLADWLTVFGEIYRQEVTPTRMKVYRMTLEPKLTAKQLDAACQIALGRCKFFPTPSEIIGAVERETKDAGQLEAERAWDSLQRHIAKWGSGRMPLYSGGKVILPPALDPAVVYATRQCGGLGYIGRVSEEGYHWARKNFVEHYARFNETAGLTELPAREEARRLIRESAPELVAKSGAR